MQVAASGGQPRPLTSPAQGVAHLYPSFLPDGRTFLYTVRGGSAPGIYLASLDDPAGTRLLADESSAQVAPSAGQARGYLLFVREGRLLAQRFDASGRRLEGEPVVVAERALLSDNGAVAAGVSNTGILLFLAGASREHDSRLAWFDRSGRLLGTEGAAGAPTPASLSPDDRSAVVMRRRPGYMSGDLWLRAVNRDTGETRLTYDESTYPFGNAVWSSDGNRIVFTSSKPTAAAPVLSMKNVTTASADATTLIDDGVLRIASDWSRDGILLYTEFSAKAGADLSYLRIDGNGRPGAPAAFLHTEFNESFGQLSPDGRWIAYLSNESGTYEVYVRSFPSGTQKVKVSASGGNAQPAQPRWNHNGRDLFYANGTAGKYTIVSAPVLGNSSGSSIEFGAPRALFDVRLNSFHPAFGAFFFSVSSDGQRFLIDHVEQASEPALNLVVNWQQAFAFGR